VAPYRRRGNPWKRGPKTGRTFSGARKLGLRGDLGSKLHSAGRGCERGHWLGSPFNFKIVYGVDLLNWGGGVYRSFDFTEETQKKKPSRLGQEKQSIKSGGSCDCREEKATTTGQRDTCNYIGVQERGELNVAQKDNRSEQGMEESIYLEGNHNLSPGVLLGWRTNRKGVQNEVKGGSPTEEVVHTFPEGLRRAPTYLWGGNSRCDERDGNDHSNE